MQSPDLDTGFEKYRKERQRRRVQATGPVRPLGEQAEVVRELERVEEREQQDRRLSREVHEFLETATRTAASIVQKVSANVRERACEQLESEMEEFLLDAASRLNHFVGDLLASRRGVVAEQRVEPQVRNIVGAPLDGFRWAGTANLADKHIGQDPFATDVAAVSREFLRQIPRVEAAAAAAAVPAEAGTQEPCATGAGDATAAGPAPGAEPTPTSVAGQTAGSPVSAQNGELEAFKGMLKDLVRQGLMGRDEARAAWQQRLARLQGSGP